MFQRDALLLKILAMVLKVTEEDQNFTRDYRGFLLVSGSTLATDQDKWKRTQKVIELEFFKSYIG